MKRINHCSDDAMATNEKRHTHTHTCPLLIFDFCAFIANAVVLRTRANNNNNNNNKRSDGAVLFHFEKLNRKNCMQSKKSNECH